MAYQEHKKSGEAVACRCAVITLSDTRTMQTDESGFLIGKMLREAGHQVVHYEVMPDDPKRLEPAIVGMIAGADVDAILTTGGTGISKRDQTIGVVERQITLMLPGFGELFRMLSWEQIGSGAMLSRAIGGIAKGKIVFCMPGSSKAVELAMSKLILPELGHLVYELRK
jgi:molybdenum cofactor biosynthesis protein B